ncbi:MAG: lactonase family protein [Planctomycetota bacterium]|jgi:6-phosphogluconolactonase
MKHLQSEAMSTVSLNPLAVAWMRWLISVGLLAATLQHSTSAMAGDWLFVSLLQERRIVTFEREPETGRLKRRGVTVCPAEPACMASSPDRRVLFVSFRSTGELASFQIEQTSGSLQPVSVVPGGDDPAYLLPDHTGRYLLSAYYQSNKVCVHRILPEGAISRHPVQTVPTAEKAHGIALDSHNALAFVPHTGANRVYQFRFESEAGRLTSNNPEFVSTDSVDRPRHVALHPNDRWAYVSNEAGDSLGVYEISSGGTLRRVQTVSTLPPDEDGARNSTARCEMTPDGRFVYVANRGHDSIAGFAIDQTSGRVSSLGQTPTEKTPRSFSIDSRGQFLYAAGQGSGYVDVLRIGRDGTLTRRQKIEAGPMAWWALAVDGAE